jgi:hypothetical protein
MMIKATTTNPATRFCAMAATPGELTNRMTARIVGVNAGDRADATCLNAMSGKRRQLPTPYSYGRNAAPFSRLNELNCRLPYWSVRNTSVRKMKTSIAVVGREIIGACNCECRQCGKQMQHVADLPKTARFKAASIFRCDQCKCIARSDLDEG